jgi:stearoyl-CoA desaturase (delta-9 desaturase)
MSEIDSKKEVIDMNCDDLNDVDIDECVADNNNEKVEKDRENVKHKFTIFGYPLSKIKWSNVVFLLVMHALAVYGYYHCIVNPVKVLTVTFIYIISVASGLGILVGSHRLWAHRSFKARWPLRLLLIILQTMSVNGSVFSYVRDHRTHHKWSDSEADPKNSNRGFFFAHMGWWLLKKDSKVIENGKKLSYDDLWKDPLIRIQHRFYIPLAIIFCYIFPTLFPLIWSEDILTAFLSCVAIRSVVVLHHMWTVNSIAHIYGSHPFDKQLRPTENKLVVYLSMGEGSHNYHHAFPWDYTTSHQKWYESYNIATLFILICSKLCFAYDLKKPSKEMVQKYVEKKGDIIELDNMHKKSLCKRLLLGAFDWIIGSVVTSWPIWSIIVFKLILGKPIFFIDLYNDIIFFKM